MSKNNSDNQVFEEILQKVEKISKTQENSDFKVDKLEFNLNKYQKDLLYVLEQAKTNKEYLEILMSKLDEIENKVSKISKKT